MPKQYLTDIPSIASKMSLKNIQNNLDGNQYFTLLHHSKAYHQLYLHLDNYKLTAFIAPWGFYKCIKIPFGLMNVPAAVQRFMKNCLWDYRDKYAIPCLDDLLIFLKTFEGHLNHIKLVL